MTLEDYPRSCGGIQKEEKRKPDQTIVGMEKDQA